MALSPQERAELRKTRPHIVIIGAGFAGLEAAKILARERVFLTIIDRNNHHLFQPLLYQVATAGLSPADIAMPVRSILSDSPNVEVFMAKVESIDPAKREVHLHGLDKISYDYLLVGTGARHSYFGHGEWEAFAPGLKTLEDATDIRRRILIAFEEAELSKTDREREQLLTFVVVGGGPTGLEMAGAIAELARFSLAKDFDRIDPKLAKVILVEAGPVLLAAFHKSLHHRAMRDLKRLGVQVELNTRVTDISNEGVTVGDRFIPARTVVWAAGVQPSSLAKDTGCPLDRSGRAIVDKDLSVPAHPEIFIAGDLAAAHWKDELTVPGMAPGAMQGGRHAARNILRRIKGTPTKPFHYLHKGSMATIGRAAAVVDLDPLHFGGFLAWLTWLFVHIFYLIGFRNRTLVLFQWFWSYLTFKRGTRLITGGPRQIGESQIHTNRRV